MMGNRSGRRFPNLSRRWSLETVKMTRRRRANFHQARSVEASAPRRPNIWLQPSSPKSRQTPFRSIRFWQKITVDWATPLHSPGAMNFPLPQLRLADDISPKKMEPWQSDALNSGLVPRALGITCRVELRKPPNDR